MMRGSEVVRKLIYILRRDYYIRRDNFCSCTFNVQLCQLIIGENKEMIYY